MFEIKSIKTLAFYPQTDGLVERFNATMKQMLCKYIGKFNRQWNKVLPYILFSYRSIPQETTGYSPFQLLYGRNPRGPRTFPEKSGNRQTISQKAQCHSSKTLTGDWKMLKSWQRSGKGKLRRGSSKTMIGPLR